MPAFLLWTSQNAWAASGGQCRFYSNYCRSAEAIVWTLFNCVSCLLSPHCPASSASTHAALCTGWHVRDQRGHGVNNSIYKVVMRDSNVLAPELVTKTMLMLCSSAHACMLHPPATGCLPSGFGPAVQQTFNDEHIAPHIIQVFVPCCSGCCCSWC